MYRQVSYRQEEEERSAVLPSSYEFLFVKSELQNASFPEVRHCDHVPLIIVDRVVLHLSLISDGSVDDFVLINQFIGF